MAFTVCTVNYHTSKYIAFQDLTFRRLAKDKTFRRLIIDVTPGQPEAEGLRQLPYCEVVPLTLKGITGSESHGVGINAALSRVQTEYAVIADPDTAALMENWDHLCQSALTGRTIAIGTPYDRELTIRYQNFPNAIFFFFKCDPFLKWKVDFRPMSYWQRKIKAKLRPFLPFLSSEDPDVGWRLPRVFARRGYTASCFEPLFGTDPGAIVLKDGARGDEFHWQGKPILTHQGRSGPRGFDEDPVSTQWIDRVCHYLEMERPRRG